ncbi:MAG: hypothetical protein EYR95_18015 [Phormidium sp. SL48-SHIP]|nr:MAG: hypothetical protein EYR95_18015 [Phormidium sp. SL48-SHIP]
MKGLKQGLKQRSVLGLAGLSLSLLGLGVSSEAAIAQAAYGSYVGVGGSLGLQEGNDVSGVVAVRYRLLEVPISLRTQVLAGSGIAIVPTVSYDIPIDWETDAYIGAGVAFTGSEDTPVGNTTSFVLQPGIDRTFANSNVVVFGNAIIAFDAYEETNRTGVSIQGGVGIQF